MAHRLAFLSSARACAQRRNSSARTFVRAHSSFVIRSLSETSLRKQAGAFGLAPEGISAPVGASQKGEQVLGIHAFTFASTRLVTQPVTRLIFRGASLEQRHAAARISAARAHGGTGHRAG